MDFSNVSPIRISKEQYEYRIKYLSQLNYDNCFHVTTPEQDELLCFRTILRYLVPLIHGICEKNNPHYYRKFGGNLGNHIPVITMDFLQLLMPKWEWSLYLMEYSCDYLSNRVTNQHSFIYGKQGSKLRVIDMWDLNNEPLWAEVDTLTYPFQHSHLRTECKIHNLSKQNYKRMVKEKDNLLLGDVPTLLTSLRKTVYREAYNKIKETIYSDNMTSTYGNYF